MSAALTANPATAREAPERLLIVDPLEYPDWDRLVSAHPESSFFHGSAWARVLHETYGHSPRYVCGLADKRLASLLPVMEVSSAVTGRRGVSLPFSDFCEPLTNNGEARSLFEAALEYGRERRWKYLECRQTGESWSGADEPSIAFHGHVVDLRDREEALFKRLASPIRRGIRKAQNEAVSVDFSTSAEAVTEFFALHCLTRRRHGLPPQPVGFFKNIARFVLAAEQGFVAIARLAGKPIAALMFFHNGSEAIYKFGASDFAFQQLRPNNLAMWEGIKRCAASGLATLHLGRTSLGHEGLRQFKLGFGAREERIEYRRYEFTNCVFMTTKDRAKGWFNHIFRRAPLSFLRLSGELIYPHLS